MEVPASPSRNRSSRSSRGSSGKTRSTSTRFIRSWEWAAKVKAHPSGFTCHKFGFPNSDPAVDKARDVSNRLLTTRELVTVQKGFENCREAIGWDRDLMVHCHWEYDLRTAIQIAD